MYRMLLRDFLYFLSMPYPVSNVLNSAYLEFTHLGGGVGIRLVVSDHISFKEKKRVSHSCIALRASRNTPIG